MAKKKANQSKALPNSPAVQDDELDKLILWVNESDDITEDTRILAEKSRNYYDSIQWTDAEIEKLKKQKQAPTVINRIKPKVDMLMGMERANRTTVKAMPRTPHETQGAQAATEAVRFVLQDNNYNRVRSDVWENLCIEGTGGVEINVKETKDPKNPFKITIKHIMWDRIIYDPHSRRKNFSDARYLGQVIWMDYDEALALYPNGRDVLESMQSGSQTYDDKPRWMDNTRRRVKIVELDYKKDSGVWCYACFTRGGFLKAPKETPFKNEEGDTETRFEFASLFVDRNGGRYGAEKQLLDVQDEINKRRSKALHLMSVRQVRWERGAVEDINKARDELAKPDGVLETTPGMEFEILKTGDMAQAQFNLLTEAKLEIDSVGANAATMGKDKTIQSGVALRQREMTGQTELAPMFDVLKDLDIRIYRKVWNRVKQYWKSEMWLRVTDDENNLKFVGLNKPMTRGEQMMEQAQQQGLPPEQLQMLAQQIAQNPLSREKVSTKNDIVNLDVDLIMDDAPDTVTQEVEDFQAMAEMVKSGFPIPPEAVIMASPLSNKDQILKMMKEQPQIPPQVQDQIKKMQEQFQQLQQENQQLKSNAQVEAAKIQADQQSSAAKLQIQHESKQMELALNAQVQGAEINHTREKASLDLQFQREKAQQEADLMVWKAKLDAETKVLVAQIAAKQAADQALLEAETAADVNFTKDEGGTKASPKPKIADVLSQLGQGMTQQAQAHQQAMETMHKAHQEGLKQIMEHISKPKTITAKSSSGHTITATTH
jgi:hypothetical protein